VLIPGAVVWIVAVSAMRVLRTSPNVSDGQRFGVYAALAVLVLALLAAYEVGARRRAAADEARHEPVPAEVDPFAGGYPVPPLPGQTVLRSSGSIDRHPEAATGGATRVPVGAGPAGGRPDDDEEVRGG
jgi:NADH-quinone oxidoreductase subunit H